MNDVVKRDGAFLQHGLINSKTGGLAGSGTVSGVLSCVPAVKPDLSLSLKRRKSDSMWEVNVEEGWMHTGSPALNHPTLP